MIIFPNCKVNLGLNIIARRSDGYHDIETVFYPLHLLDVIEVIAGSAGSTGKKDVSFTTSGIPPGTENDNNLCVRAFRLIKIDFPELPPLQLHLHKAIPVGAGLGGGSADAAFTIKLLNDKFRLGLSPDQMISYALRLGSDCPFFIINAPCFAKGRGELMESVNIDLLGFKFVLVNPGIHIQTAHAFSQATPILPANSIQQIIQQPVNTWKEELKNDLEIPAFNQFPVIKKVKEELYNAGAVYASMSGSGSTVYGIFEKKQELQFNFPSHYLIKECNHFSV